MLTLPLLAISLVIGSTKSRVPTFPSEITGNLVSEGTGTNCSKPDNLTFKVTSLAFPMIDITSNLNVTVF